MVFSCFCCCYSSYKSLFCLYQQNKSSKYKVKFIQTSNHCKRFLEAAKLAYANKAEESIISQKLDFQDFEWIANNVLNNGKSVYRLYSAIWMCFLLHLIKQDCWQKAFWISPNLMAQVFLYLFFLLELIWNCIIFL